jgi:DNA-binding LytR/AlgR family response regulator
MKAIIVDDERLARNELKRLLENFPTIEVIGEASNTEEAGPLVEELKPDDSSSSFLDHGNWEKLNHFVNKQISNWYNKQLVREQESSKKIFQIKTA